MQTPSPAAPPAPGPRHQQGRVKLGMLLLALAGLALAIGLVMHYGAADIGAALGSIGWGMVPVLFVHLAQVWLSGQGWHAMASVERPGPVWVFAFARWIREGVAGLLPLTQIGGELVSLRIVILQGYRNGIAAGSMIADLGTQIMSQGVFTLLGLGFLLIDGHQGPVVEWTLLGLVASLSVLPGFFIAQRRGLLRATEAFFIRVADRFPAFQGASLEGLHDSIHRIFARPTAVLKSFNAHLLSWLIGAFEIWLILHFLGVDLSVREALVIESLSQVVRSVAFAVPGVLGVQEGSFMLIGAIYGLTPQISLALSLAKRVRELLLGLPALIGWQLAEGRRFCDRRRVATRPE